MKRKKFVKHMMALGCQRNEAQRLAEKYNAEGWSYIEAFWDILEWIVKEVEKAGDMRDMTQLFWRVSRMHKVIDPMWRALEKAILAKLVNQ